MLEKVGKPVNPRILFLSLKEFTCSIYPNPSYGFSRLQLGEEFLYLETIVTVYDLNGRIILRNSLIPERMNLTTPLRITEAGIYLVSVKAGAKEQILKWIVTKQ